MAPRNYTSKREGTQAENDFIKLRGDNFIRRSTTEEDIHQHWDVHDKEFGYVDVKAAKRFSRGSEVDYTIWWELRTVKRPPNWEPDKGWGVPNGTDRLIAVRSEGCFHLINPEDIIYDLRARCTKKGKGEFLLYGRPNRGDLMTILPLDYVREHSRYTLHG